jgi:hypothetical protein
MTRSLATLAMLLLGAGAGCSVKALPFPAGAAEDAGAQAGELVAREARRSAHVVAVSYDERTRLEVLEDGVALFTDLFVYRATDDGDLVRIGDGATYAAMLNRGDDLAGYDVARAESVWYGVTGTVERPKLDGDLVARAWDGKAWVTAPPRIPGDDATSRAGLEIPADAQVGDIRKLPDGRRAGLASFDGKPRLFLVDGGAGGALLPIDTPHQQCRFVTAYDRKNVACRPPWGSTERPTLHRLGTAGLGRVALPAGVEGEHTLTVGDDGSLWFADRAEVLRFTPDERLERFALPAPDASLARARYASYPILTRSRPMGAAPVEARVWETLVVLQAPPIAPAKEVDQIVPRPDGTAWIVAHDGKYTRLVMHVGRRPTRAAIAIGSADDQRNEALGTRGVRTWVGHCPQLFVAVPHTDVWSRVEEVRDVVMPALARDKNVGAERGAVVEGRLGERHVAGVLLWRSTPKIIEAAATALALHFTDNPAAPPTVTCTAPVLERALLLGMAQR